MMMCWGGKSSVKKCKKKIPDDPLTRPPINGRSGACPNSFYYFLYHPIFEKCRLVPWLILGALLFLGVYFISLLFPVPSSLSHTANCNPADSAFVGGGETLKNEPEGQDAKNLGDDDDKKSHHHTEEEGHDGQEKVRRNSLFDLTNLLHSLSGWRFFSQPGMGKNFADCHHGASIHRVKNFPPFRGWEDERGTHQILETLHPDFFWSFKAPGIVQITLSQPIFISGMAIKHIVNQQKDPKGNDNKMGKAPNHFEFYAFNEIPEKEGTAPLTFLGKFTFSDYLKGHQNFILKQPTTKNFSQVELRFLDSQNGGEIVNVYKVEIYGHE